LTRKQTTLTSVILIVILGFAVYANSLNGQFVWDDHNLVKDNTYIKNWSYPNKIFGGDIGAAVGIRYGAYRPLQMLTYMFDYSLWKLDVRGYHFTNVLLHILAALAIFWFVSILFDHWPLALFTSVLFLIHPINTEAVTYISGRSDSLALLFILLCFIFYIKGLDSKNTGFYLLSISSYTLALLSRENSLILPALLLLYHYSFKKKIITREFFSVVCLGLSYVVLRLTALKSILPSLSSCPYLFERMPGFFVAIANYIRLILLPFNLHMEYGKKIFHFVDFQAITGVVITSFSLLYAFKKRKLNRLIFFSISWFFIALLPQSNLYPINAYMAEHWLYLPSIGFFLILAKGLTHPYQNRRFRIPAIILTVALFTFYANLTIKQNIYWREPIFFYERTLKYAPDNPKLYSNLGNVYYALDQKGKAIAAYQKAIEIKPDHLGAYNNLGSAYQAMGKHAEAIAIYQKAIEIDSEYAGTYYNLGNLYKAIDKQAEAVAAYQKAISINPDIAAVHNNLGLIYQAIHKNQEAIASYRRAIEIDPGFAGAYYNLGNVYSALDNEEEAIASYKNAISINPDYAEAYNNLGVIYNRIGKYEEAIVWLNKALELNPEYALAYFNQALAYEGIGQIKTAIQSYKAFIQLAKPDYASYIQFATGRITLLENDSRSMPTENIKESNGRD